MSHEAGKITIAGKKLSYYVDNRGQMVVANHDATKIVLGFVGSALATPVTGLTIVFGGAIGEIYLTYLSVVEDIKTQAYEIKAQGEIERMNSVLRIFGSEIAKIESDYSNYPEDVKKTYRDNLLKRMKERLQKLKN